MKIKLNEKVKAIIAMIIMLALFALASHLEQTNLIEDRQAQSDCMVKDTVYSNIQKK
ncbi:hypothetical protein [Dysgonomonas sp. ZJ279]|uniref:hypothetical protein n=1 Tax=Dysgonomonas sp. ZJ279 TaxID=2709796 RepID=UPI0013EC59DD|nr:hypothetical protein [Dysgonomonas sp. ZJ279]